MAKRAVRTVRMAQLQPKWDRVAEADANVKRMRATLKVALQTQNGFVPVVTEALAEAIDDRTDAFKAL